MPPRWLMRRPISQNPAVTSAVQGRITWAAQEFTPAARDRVTASRLVTATASMVRTSVGASASGGRGSGCTFGGYARDGGRVPSGLLDDQVFRGERRGSVGVGGIGPGQHPQLVLVRGRAREHRAAEDLEAFAF